MFQELLQKNDQEATQEAEIQTIDPRDISLDVEKGKALLRAWDPNIAALEKEIKGRKVDDEESCKVMVAMATDVKTLNKKIEEERKRLTDPALKFKKAIDAFCKAIRDRLDKAENMGKDKISTYRHRIEMERLEAEKKAKEEAERVQAELFKEAEEKGIPKEQVPIVEAPVAKPPDKVVRTENGAAAHTRKAWACEIVDPDQVPREYCTPDQVKLNGAVKAGVREIAGCKIYEKVTTVLRGGF